MWGLIVPACCAVWAVCANAQSPRLLSKTVPAGEVLARGEVRIDLNGGSISTDDLKGLKLKIEFLPSGDLINSSHVSVRVGGEVTEYLSIRFGERPSLNTLDNKIRVSIYLPEVETKPQDPNAVRESQLSVRQGELLNQYLETLEFAAKSQVAYAKTSRERHFYVSGGLAGGEAAVNPVLYQGNVWKKRQPINQIDFGLALDRGTGSRSDPDFLNLGFSFRKIFPLHRQSISNQLELIRNQFVSIGDELKAPNNAVSLNSLVGRQMLSASADKLNQENKAFFRAIVLTPLAPRIETSLRGHGAALLIDFINNADLQIRTGAKRVWGDADQATVNKDVNPQAKQPRGYLTWEMKLIPVAFETGVAIRNPDDPGRRGNPIVRLNTGAVGKLTYHFPCRIDVLVNRIELELKGMNRHLFNEESGLNPLTNKANSVVRGDKYAIQADLRYIFGYVLPIKNFRRRPAVTVTYKNGFFPPLYAYNNSVSVHFTLESEDDTNVNDMRLGTTQLETLRTEAALRKPEPE